MGQTRSREQRGQDGTAAGPGLGRWLAAWRHEHRFTQEQLAEALGYEVSYISKIERGERPPTRPFLTRVSAVVDTPVETLFRVARTPSARIRLPVPSTPLAGRGAELAHLTAELREPGRAVSLLGPPGIGKTRLAIEVAWSVAHRFRHGACFVALADTTADAVPGAVLHALGLRDEGAPPLEALVDALAHRSLLLVLDNFEHVLGAAATVARVLAEAPGARILVTSREALGLAAEHTYQVPGLAFPTNVVGAASLSAHRFPAITLFAERVRAIRPDFAVTDANAAAVAEICARLDGLPLAITLTAGAIRYLSETDIAASLSDRLELPTEGRPDLYVHDRLAAALDWSWRLLGPVEQSLLARLGVFAGGCTLAAAEAVGTGAGAGARAGAGAPDLLAALAALERRNLVESVATEGGDTRFVLLETVRRYARDRLAEQGEAVQTQDRHCSWFVRLAERAQPEITCGPDQGRWIRALQDDHANLSAAFAWALEHDPERALRLSAASWRFFSMWRTSEGRRWLDQALAAHCPADGLGLRALNGSGVLGRLQGDLDHAMGRFEQAEALATRLGDEAELALAVLNRGIVAEDRGRYDEAGTLFSEAMGRYRAVGDQRGVAHAVNCLGVIALRADDHDRAAERFLDALGRFREIEDLWSAAWTATNLGWIAEMAGEYLDATDWYDQSRKMRESVNDDHGLAISLASLGRVARRQEDPARAVPHLGEALELFHRLGDRRRAAATLGELAAVAAQRRKPALAARLVGVADQLLERLGVPRWADEAALREETMAALRQKAGESTVKRAWSQGRALSLEDAMLQVTRDL